MKVLKLALIAALMLTPIIAAHGAWTHCGGNEIIVTDSYYVVVDTVGPNAGWAWLYQESNGIQHLQRGVGPYGADPCDEGVDSDTGALLF